MGPNALGWGGQYIVVNPAANLVAVRALDVSNTTQVPAASWLSDFPTQVEALSIK
jgi:hypothetical protein